VGEVSGVDARERELIPRVSFRRERVVLSSGAESDFCLDLRQRWMRPRGVLLVGDLPV
jgi:hypothetical protein